MKISKILSQSIVSYYHREYTPIVPLPEDTDPTTQQENNKPTTKQPEDNRTNGKFSGKSRSRLKNTISKLIEANTVGRFGVRWKAYRNSIQLNFVTLTLPAQQEHDDRKIKAIALNPFISELCTEHNVNTYIWRAEKQKNNNIHFHIIIDSRIHHSVIRDVWNRCIERLGYVNSYRERMIQLSEEQYIATRKPKTYIETQKAIYAYRKGVSENWSRPNSTDIHRIEKINQLGAYISKYMTKKETDNDTGVLGHCWGKSENLEACEVGKCILDHSDVAILEREATQGKVRILHKEYVTYYGLSKCDVYSLRLLCATTALEQAQINWCVLAGLPYVPRETHHY